MSHEQEHAQNRRRASDAAPLEDAFSHASPPGYVAASDFSNLRVLGVFLLGISVGISIMFFYMQIRNPDPLAELKKNPDVIQAPLDKP